MIAGYKVYKILFMFLTRYLTKVKKKKYTMPEGITLSIWELRER